MIHPHPQTLSRMKFKTLEEKRKKILKIAILTTLLEGLL